MKDFKLLPEECESKEELLHSIKKNVIANMSLYRPLTISDIEFAVERTLEWVERYNKVHKNNKI